MDFPGDGNDVIERSDHHKPTRKRNFTAQPWSFCCNGLLEDLYQYIGFLTKHFIDFTSLYNFSLNGKR